MRCLQNLHAGKSLFPSICLTLSILGGLENSFEVELASLTTKKALCLLEEQLGLVRVVLQVITHYDSQVKEALKQLVRKGKPPPEKVESHVFAGTAEHQPTLEKLLELLEFVVLGSDWAVTVGTTNLDALWKTFVLSPNFSSDQVLFLQFINKKRQRSTGYFSEAGNYGKTTSEVNLLTAEEQKHLFTKILCNSTFVDYSKLSPGLSRCFHTYFRLINREEGSLSPGGKQVEVVNFEQLAGMDSLWCISVEAQNERARDESRELLVDLHLRLGGSEYSPAARQQIMQGFVDRGMSILREASVAGSQSGTGRSAFCVV